jgi:Tol biopolymer transport system component
VSVERIGQYVITGKLGEGGMGVVYRGRDPALNREVAIKVLPPALANDANLMARFQREARTLASLSHPNIATVYGLEDGALVMELVEGPTLADRLRAGPIPVAESLAIARQIAEGLEAAHDKGIVHRDLKPANVKVNPEGRVKLLDFGLAKALDDTPAPGDPDPDPDGPTLTAPPPEKPLSSLGMVMGTPGYMSPEQARGGQIDKRTDVWAFGVVLYEMLAGRRLHADTDEPDWSALPAATPDWVRLLLARCLERDRRKRLRDIGEVPYFERRPTAPVQPPAPPERARYLAWLIPAAAVLGGLAVWVVRAPTPVEQPLRTFSFPVADLYGGNAPSIAISPNGKHIAYVAADKLWVRDLASEKARMIGGTEGAEAPFWSPDSLQIAFCADAQLRKVPVSGGAPVLIATLAGSCRGGAWSPDRTKVVISTVPGGLGTVSEDGRLHIVTPWKVGHIFYSPQFLPGNRHVLAGVGARHQQRVVVFDLANRTGETIADGADPQLAPSGHVVFRASSAQGGIRALPFDPVTRKLKGNPVPVAESGVRPSVAGDGTLIWTERTSEDGELTWLDRSGQPLGVVRLPVKPSWNGFAVSPDGRGLAFVNSDSVWHHNLETGTLIRLTASSRVAQAPHWSPSGKEIVFRSVESANPGIYLQPVDGSGGDRRIGAGVSWAWSPDGTTILGLSDRSFMLRRSPDQSFAESASQGDFAQASFSPDSRFVVQSSNERGRTEVVVRSFPDGNIKRQISPDGGECPRWGRRGNEILYVKGDALMAVPVAADGTPLGPAVELFRNAGLRIQSPTLRTWDESPDGKRFLVWIANRGTTVPIHVALGWTGLLRQDR